ncbi:30S ribosomal protein S6 [Symbiobacterium thermophilum]|uniref:Small ribosomal subunit protein bS6 n=2 Tax=Symbiobacterium thermophilum TaxID=2734 RepID=RS6_SYMTH|nr:30S ribosomal protein S6 [Symbiobacterium thermophilum]Q67J48.1 RecName: Full=Small ribosomal subunit protein bS6; AltName: Full=30S ribosomal protein S6 [Symbiobacterium thermophilum IAM 14863]MBY6275925.1 30S ribosomal protein S6 [Symbiobacterium thermophilum]OTA41891.1 MAG: 30S ribosomal protein S6 [Symbiobacterium thermophilum]BAD42302.1 30S ribosomal protein S6 [Symbiobacterium thermophilum IAM 14863]
MRKYEMMVIARPDLDEAGLQALSDKIAELITSNGGTVESQDAWKKQRLAYEIKHLREGFYSVFNFTGEPRTANELNRVLKITDEVVRFLIVRPAE